jgi:non-structural maintenance of chromosomes element 4
VGQVRAGTTQGGGGGGGTQDHFDWELLGEAAGACFNAVPSDVCFLNGPLQKDAPPVQRKVAQQQRRQVPQEEAVEERPEDVQGHTEKDDNKLSAIEKSMHDMAKELKNKVDHQYRENKRKLEQAFGKDKSAIPMDIQKKFKKYGVEIDAIQFLFNPRSFTQTVENIFHYSFLVKKGTGAIALRDEKGLNIEGIQTKPGLKLKYVSEDKMAPIARQSILSLTMHDWRALCDVYQVEDGGLPHRKIHKEAHANSLSQASGMVSSQ